MGYVKLKALIVSSWDRAEIEEAREKAVEIYCAKFKGDPHVDNASELITPIVESLVNGQHTFFIAPDASKEGWDTAEKSDEARAELIKYLESVNNIEFAEVRFGGDEPRKAAVLSHNY